MYCSLVQWSWEYAGHILIIHLYTVLYPGSMVLGIRWNYIYITSIYCTVARFNGPGNTLDYCQLILAESNEVNKETILKRLGNHKLMSD